MCVIYGRKIITGLRHYEKEVPLIRTDLKQECIPVGCVPPAHWSYLRISSYPTHAPPRATMHAPREQPHMSPPEHPHMPPRATMHAPWEQPCMPPPEQPCTDPWSNHACPPEQPRMPPRSNHACPPRATMHTPRATTHAPPRATMHTPLEQPCMPPRATTPPREQPHMPRPPREQPCMPPLWTEWHTLLKILPYPNFVAGGKYAPIS